MNRVPPSLLQHLLSALKNRSSSVRLRWFLVVRCSTVAHRF